MIDSRPRNKVVSWFSQAPWRILVLGVTVALALAALLMRALMQASLDEVTALVSTLAITSLLSLGVGYFLYRRRWTRLPSLTLTLVLTYTWAAVLTIFNVWVMSLQMYASSHDLVLSIILLLFAGIIATTFGIFVATSITDSLRQLANTAQRVAGGDLSARVAVTGNDEVARVGEAFNEMAAQLQQAAVQREELDSLRRDLVAWTSHDLRTPLTSVRAMVEALHDGVVEDPEMVRRYYSTIRADVIALNKLIDDLFELAQLDAGGLDFEIAPHSLSDLISDALERFQALAQQRNIILDGKVEANVDPVPLDASKISRVLANLLSNALRYTPAGGEVKVRARRTAAGAEVTIQDSGPGFNPDDLPRVFEKFYRGEQARSRTTGGAGLGLAIAHSIVIAHGGRIWAENIVEKGALIGFILPVY